MDQFITTNSGGFSVVGLATPGAPTITNGGTAGATTYTYKIVAKTASGAVTVAGSTGSTTTGNATLSTTNYNIVTWDLVPGAERYDVYCTVGASPTGRVGRDVRGPIFRDTTGVGDGATSPTMETTTHITFSTIAARLKYSSFTPGTETNGSLMTTESSWISFSTAGQCGLKLLLANAAASGDFATVRMRARSDAAGSTECGNFSASAGVNNHGDLYALRGYAQPNAYTNSGGSNIVCGLYSCIDATASSSGRRWSTWIDDHSTTKAAGGHYLLRMSDNGSTAKDGAITVYNGGRLPVLFNFEDAAGFLSDSDPSLSTQAGSIAVQTPAGTRYIALYSD